MRFSRRRNSIQPYGAIAMAGGGGGAASLNTIMLIHLNGADAGTTVTDDIAANAWSGFGYTTTTATKQFGTASLTMVNPALGELDGGTFPVTGSLNGNFTIEGWFRVTSATGTAQFNVANLANGNIHATLLVTVNSVEFQVKNSAGTTLHDIVSTPTLSALTWYHIAGVKEGTSYSTFFDGNRLETAVDATANAGAINIATVFGSGSNGQQIWFDELRFSTTARYSGATYTVPVAEFTVD